MAKQTVDAPIANADAPDVREPVADGLRNRKRDYPAPDAGDQERSVPKMGGASSAGASTLKGPNSDRSAKGASRQAGMTPRPTDKPIGGSARGDD